MSDDGLDQFISPTRDGISSQYVYENSGHRLLCPRCKKFQRASADWIEGPTLRIACKVCGAREDFVLRDTGLVPKSFNSIVQEFTMKRARNILRRR